MQTITPQKLILIAVVLGLGAVLASIVSDSYFSAGRSSMFDARNSDTTGSMRKKWPLRTPIKNSRHEFLERTSFRYVAASGAVRDNRDLEFDY